MLIKTLKYMFGGLMLIIILGLLHGAFHMGSMKDDMRKMKAHKHSDSAVMQKRQEFLKQKKQKERHEKLPHHLHDGDRIFWDTEGKGYVPEDKEK